MYLLHNFQLKITFNNTALICEKRRERREENNRIRFDDGCRNRKRATIHRRTTEPPPFSLPSHSQGNHLSLSFILSIIHPPNGVFLFTQIDQMWSSDKYNSGLIDRFTLLIPYCLDFIKCMYA